ncbi:MAG: cupin domain-containing protein [Candidimonas sp.]|nr:MAG: cupin domain-containing protein [Candidimonas sp.]TAM22292.1 MAG: cupin domain-containing protein [Candidimonas sp.]TAM80180.1 MAG: cupin domain-containing protein [Candidimonas sp.]
MGSIGEQEVIRLGQLEIRYLLDGCAGASPSRLGSFELTVPPNANVPPPHSHADNDEFVYVLDGVLRYSVNEITRDLGVGDSMFTPRGAVHAFNNPYSKTARALIMQTPDIGPQYFRDVRAIIDAGGPPDKTKLLEVMTRYGLTLSV